MTALTINLETLPPPVYSRLVDQDAQARGTVEYLGLAYFWNYKYRHYLRDATTYKRRRIHDLFLRNRLVIDGQSANHLAIIRQITRQQ